MRGDNGTYLVTCEKCGEGWNDDVSAAPRSFLEERPDVKGRARSVLVERPVLLATKCGRVTKSHWLPDQERWLMLKKGEVPVAWRAWPTHPLEEIPA